MSYEPRTYWPARLAREGTKYVGRGGMTDAASAEQAEKFWSYIEPHIPSDCEALLDYGCGVGRLALRLSGCCECYSGVDICQEALLLAPDLSDGGLYDHLEGDRIPFEDGTFDCIVACTVLQHIVDHDEFRMWTAELNRVAADGCTFLTIDSHHEGDGSAHVRARTPMVLADALGCDIVHIEVISVERTDSHWLIVGSKT